MRHARPAAVSTIVVAIGLALTSIGLSRGLPFDVGGVGSRATIAADLWAHGTAVSPPLILLVTIGLLAAWASRTGAGGRRAARWLAAISTIGLVAGLIGPTHIHALLGDFDAGLTPVLFAGDVAWIGLVIAAVLRAREGRPGAVRPDTAKIGRVGAPLPSAA